MYTAEKKIDEDIQLKLPQPKGYKLLISIPKMAEKTESGVYMPDKLVKMEETASIIGFVVEVGPEAYKDDDKFPSGPYCKKVILLSLDLIQVLDLKLKVKSLDLLTMTLLKQ